MRLLLLAVLTGIAAGGCGVDARSDDGPHAVFAELRGLAKWDGPDATVAATDFEWPQGERRHAVIEVAGVGAIRAALYPELAPETVANFEKLAASGFYDGTTFHRVIPGFMIQGGDPNSRDDDPANDGQGGPGYEVPDEFGEAPFTAGTLAMANRGSPGTAGSQFFIVHGDSLHLHGKYSVFGRVVDGFERVDAIARVATDATGRWGPANRPIEDVVIEEVRIE